MKHPIAAIRSEILGDESLDAHLAYAAAVSFLCRRGSDGERGAGWRNIQTLQEYLSIKGRKWPLWDRSGMRSFKGPLLYYLVRSLRPLVVVETGVAAGVSSSFVLQAMKDNRQGTLVSIDLPGGDPEAVAGSHGPGWIVPQNLREAWVLILGDARDLLPTVLIEHLEVGMVIHDDAKASDHVLWELKTSWNHIIPGGVLALDDIDMNDAFDRFCTIANLKGLRTHQMGLIRKPR